jgi:hypothetical protein
LTVPTLTAGKRNRADKTQVIAYAGKASLLALLDDAEGAFLNLFEEAARHDWIDGERFQDFDQALSHLVIKYDVRQS